MVLQMVVEMSYLPFKSIIYRLSVKRQKLIVPDYLSRVGWHHGFRVKIIPSQTFCYFDGLGGGVEYKQSQLDLQVNCRQHLMPHNGQLATTIQTLVGEINGVGEWTEYEMETLTYISTPEGGKYQAYYVLYRKKVGLNIGNGEVVFSANIIEPRNLSVIQSTLLNPFA